MEGGKDMVCEGGVTTVVRKPKGQGSSFSECCKGTWSGPGAPWRGLVSLCEIPKAEEVLSMFCFSWGEDLSEHLICFWLIMPEIVLHT